MMKKISLTIVVGLGLSLASFAFADSASLYVSPASGNYSVGSAFTANVAVNPFGNKICVVEGTLTFTNASCQSITVASGLTAQTTPTCTNPTFTIGIPKCTTAVQNILSVSVKGLAAGNTGVSFSGVKVIGVGADVPSTMSPASFSITNSSAPASTGSPAPTATQSQFTAPAANGSVIVTGTGSNDASSNPLQEAGAASLSSTMHSVLNSPVLIIISIIVLILVIMWVFDRVKGHQKNPQ